jgi:hypothetical protein
MDVRWPRALQPHAAKQPVNSLTINGQDIVVIYGQGTTGTNNGTDWLGAPDASGADDVRLSLPTHVRR